MPFGSLKSEEMSSQVDTLYGANMEVFASATDWPRSKTSGARLVPLRDFAALISSWLAASGWAELTLMPYLSLNALITLA